jgi:uncharacterized protein
VNISRIGLTPLKGARHVEQTSVQLTLEGPVGDRAFCLVDRARARVLRTVENPTLLQASASWELGVLAVQLPNVFVEGEPTLTSEELKIDYWGRVAQLEVVDGPWAAAYSEHLGFEVELARPVHAGEVVYGASVSVVTTSSLRLLEERLGRHVASERFRSTFLVNTDELAPHVEDEWVGRELQLGDARVQVRGVVPRCAVIDLDPATGRRDGDVLATLAGYRRAQGEISFGVDAVVTVAGRVRTGDVATLGRG